MSTAQLAAKPVFQRWFDRALGTGEPNLLTEAKRQSERIVWIAPAAVLLRNSDPQRRIPGRIQDISREGVGIHCREPISPGTPVRIYAGVPFSQDEFIEGIVTHCTATMGGFKIGGQLTAGRFADFPFPD